MRRAIRLGTVALTLGTSLFVAAAEAADVPLVVRGNRAERAVILVPTEGVASTGPDCAPTAALPAWRNVWLGHFFGRKLPRYNAERHIGRLAQ